MNYRAMKLLNFFKIISFSFIILFSVQCSKYHGESEQYTVDSPGSGSQVVPATSVSATAAMTGGYNSTNNTLSGSLSWTGLSGAPTGIYFHGPAPAGLNNIYQFVLVKVPTVASGSMSFASVFTEAQEESLVAGWYYYEIRTAAYPNGEIRGQIILQ